MTFKKGDRVKDLLHNKGTVISTIGVGILVRFDSKKYGTKKIQIDRVVKIG